MGAVRSKLVRAVRSQYETESRMHKVIGKEKPVQAPRHPTTVASYAKLINENPDLQNISKDKDSNFLNMLTDFKVDSTDPEVRKRTPLDATQARLSKKKKIIPGKLTAVEMLQLFDRHLKDPEKWTKESIAKHYRLEKELVHNLLTHYSSFNILKMEKPPGPLDQASFP